MKRILIGLACSLLASQLFAAADPHSSLPRRADAAPGSDFARILAKSHGEEECETNCLNDYYACTDGCWDYPCIQECDYWYVQCHNYCPERCDGPTYRNVAVRTPLNVYDTGWDQCYYRSYFAGGTVYERWYYYGKVETYRETTNCDGSKTYTLLSTSYEQYYCYRENWPQQSCSPSSPYYGPTCNF